MTLHDRLRDATRDIGRSRPDLVALQHTARRRRRRARWMGSTAGVVALAAIGTTIAATTSTGAGTATVTPAQRPSSSASAPATPTTSVATPSSTAPRVASTSRPPSSPADPRTWQVSVTGYGPLRIGMTEKEVSSFLADPVVRPGSEPLSVCRIVTSSSIPDVLLVFGPATFISTWVDPYPAKTGGPSSVSGVRVGMSESALRSAFGPGAVAQQPVSTTGTDYTLDAGGGKADALVQNGVVTYYSEGRTAGGEGPCS